MPIYSQIILLIAGFIIFVVAGMYLVGLGVRRVCFRIIAEMEEAGAFKPSRAVHLQDERKNFFRVGTGNIRPKALSILLADEIVIKTDWGKYYLNREKLAAVKSQIKNRP